MIIPAPNDIAFSVFGFGIYYYGIIMAIAMFVAILVGNALLNSNLKGVIPSKDIILEFAPVIIILGILGARIYFCMLNPVHYLTHPLEIIDIREGGLSIHGGILGGILSVVLMSKKHHIPILRILDCMSPATILGQAIGRWGNYFNSEAYGLPVVSQNWGLYVPLQRRVAEFSQYELFHPTFLYESILDFSAFLILIFVLKKSKNTGMTFFAYLTIYAVIRFVIEQIRIDSALNIGSLPIALVVSVVMFTVGVAGIIKNLKN